MRAPLMLEEAGVGVDVAVLRWIGGPWSGRTVLRIGAVGVLGPEAVEDEGGVAGALGCAGVGVTELGGPGEVEEVVVEVLCIAGRKCECCARVGVRCGLGRRPGRWGAGGEEEKKGRDGGCRFLLHGGSKDSRELDEWACLDHTDYSFVVEFRFRVADHPGIADDKHVFHY